MKLVNNSEQFIVRFDSNEFTIPKGEFEVVSDKLVNHIMFKAQRWGFDVRQLTAETLEVKPIEKKEVIKPIASGASTETLPKKEDKPKKDA